jgi:uncharacterized protein (TIGR03067 family)
MPDFGRAFLFVMPMYFICTAELNLVAMGLVIMTFNQVYLRSAFGLLLLSGLLAMLVGCGKLQPKDVVLSGDWDLLHTEADGVVYPDEQAHGVHLNMQDSIFSIYRVRSDELYHGKYLVQDEFYPRHLDIWVDGYMDHGLKRNGIYRLKGDTLEACFAAPGAYRPAYFETRKGDKQVLTVWVRRQASQKEQ